MKKRLGVNAVLAFVLVLWSFVPTHHAVALERSVPAVTMLDDGSSYFLGEMNGELFYEHESQTWRSNGEPNGTVSLSVATPLTTHTGGATYICFPFCPHHYTKGESVNDLFLFAASDGVHGIELWRSDGTPAGTYMVKDITPGDGNSFPENLMATSNLLFFTTSIDDYSSGIELWRSDGTPDGTFILAALPTSDFRFSILNGLLFFDKGGGLWVSDGTVASTSFLMAGVGQFLGRSDDRFFFSTLGDGYLWVADGTVGGTVSLTDFPVYFLGCDNEKCFFSENTTSGSEGLWVTDGTVSGTTHLIDFTVASVSCANGLCYFSDYTTSTPEGLWVTDGTMSGTIQLVDFPTAFYSCINGWCFFSEITSSSTEGTVTDGIWITDGSLSGTFKLIDLTNPSGVSNLVTANGIIYFDSNNELWKTDGTSTGTMMVKAFDVDHQLRDFIVLNGTLWLKVLEVLCHDYSCAPVGSYLYNWYLYKSDGTESGTRLVADFAQVDVNCPTPLCGANTFFIDNSTIVDGKWFFEALDPVLYTPKLWVVTNVFFQDVLPNHWAFSWVEKLADTGITGGCNTGQYCPDNSVTRAQMAVFLEKGLHYPDAFTAPNVEPTFTDTVGHWAKDWIEALKNDGITAGCAEGLYCPESAVTRAQMAVFLLKAKHGSSYMPPTATGVFTDVPATYWAAPWIEQLAKEGITSGCGTTTYCPENPVTRAQMAVFLVKAFGLP